MRVKQPLAVIAAASGPGNGSTTGVGAGQSGAHIGGSEEEVEVESEGGGGGGGKKYWLVIGIPTGEIRSCSLPACLPFHAPHHATVYVDPTS